MSNSSIDIFETTLLLELLVRVPLATRPMLLIASKKINILMNSVDFWNRRIALGWGSETLVAQLTATKDLLQRLEQWTRTLDDPCNCENMFLSSRELCTFRSHIGVASNYVTQVAYLRVGGPQMSCESVYEQQFGVNRYGQSVYQPFGDYDPRGASTQLRDLWWIALRSLMDGTRLPKCMKMIAFIQNEDFEYEEDGAGYDLDGENIKIAMLIRSGSEYALLTSKKLHVAFHVGWNIQAWVDVPADWGRSTFIRLFRDFASTRMQSHHGSMHMVNVETPPTCYWSDSYEEDVNNDPRWPEDGSEDGIDNFSDDDSDKTWCGRKVSHKASAWPFKSDLIGEDVAVFLDGPGVRFLPGTTGVQTLPVDMRSCTKYSEFTKNTQVAPGVLSEGRASYDEIVDCNISHNDEIPVSSEEAFARNAELHIAAEMLSVPVAGLSPDWPLQEDATAKSAMCMQMTEMREILEDNSMNESSSDQLYLLEFSRTPRSFHEALDNSAILMDCHNAIKAVGLCCKLESGTRLYVMPEQHSAALRAVADLKLQSRHVVAFDRFVDAVTEAIDSINGREQVREKKRQRVPAAEDWAKETKKDFNPFSEIPMLVSKTFIHIPLPPSLCSESSSGAVTASTTDADLRKGRNPR